MKRSVVIAVSCLSFLASSYVLAAESLDAIPEDVALKFGEYMVKASSKIENPQVTIEGDVAKSNGVHVPDTIGVLIVPHKDLAETEEQAAKFKEEAGAALAYLFTYNIAPVVDGQTVDKSKLRTVSIRDESGAEHEINVLLLAVRQLPDDDYRLYGYGSGDEPVIDAKFSEASASVAEPVAVEVKDVDEDERQGNVVVTVFGKYQAKFRAGHVE